MREAPANQMGGMLTPAAGVRLLVEEACNKGNLAILDLLLPPPAGPCGQDRRDAGTLHRLAQLLGAFRDAVPDARWKVEQQVVQQSTVATRLSVRGTFHGPMVGLAWPGRPATITGVVFCQFAGGRIVNLWVQADLLGLLQQLGVMPQLDLARAVALARVMRAGALLADEGERCEHTDE